MKKEEFANTMMVNTSIDSGAAPVSYVNEEFLVARDRSDGMSSIVYRNDHEHESIDIIAKLTLFFWKLKCKLHNLYLSS